MWKKAVGARAGVCIDGRGRPWHPAVDGRGASRILRRHWRAVRHSWRWRVFRLAAVVALFAPLIVWAEESVTPAQVQSGTLLLKMQSGYRVATRINSDIELQVSGMTVRATLRQQFRNDGAEWVEGIYVFPLSDTAAVDRMRMRVGERVIEGEVQEKEKARANYEAAKREGKRASLVDQQRANLFTTRIANVGPGETIDVEIEFLDTATFDNGTFSVRVPTTLTPRYIPGAPSGDRKGSGWAADTAEVPDASLITPPAVVTSRDHRLSFRATIDPGMPLDFVASRYHPVDVESDSGIYDLRFSLVGTQMDHDVELLWRPTKSAAPRALVFSESKDDKSHLLLMLVPPTEAPATDAAMPRELIFVIDTSGSMHGVSMEQAKNALLLALDGLRPVDRFNVIQFDSTASALYPSAMAASGVNVQAAKASVRGLSADGGTEMRSALELALRPQENDAFLRQIIFITDGSVGNEEGLYSLIENRLGASRLFTVGIGSAPNSWFMRKAAEAGRGTHVTISALHEVEERMQTLFKKLEQPQVTDIALEWPNGGKVDAYPATVPDLYFGEPIVVKARFDTDAHRDSPLLVRGRSAGGDWQAEVPLPSTRESVGIAATWARAHIASLLDRERRGENSDTVRAEVVRTALAHHLVSKYTSLVAVDKTPVRPVDADLNEEQVPNLLPYGQNHQAIFGFPATATRAPHYRRWGSVCLLLGTLLLFGRVWSSRGNDDAET